MDEPAGITPTSKKDFDRPSVGDDACVFDERFGRLRCDA